MLNLIKKDFFAGYLFLLGVVIFAPFITWMEIWAMIDDFGGLILGIFTFITMLMCIASAFIFMAVDSSPNTDMIFASLPVKRSTIVAARYLTSYTLMLSCYLIIVLTCFSAVYLFNKSDQAFNILLSLRGLASMSLFLIFILSFILPFVFKYGSGKGFTTALITQIVLVIFIPIAKFVLNVLNGIFEFDIALFSRLLNSTLRWLIALPAYQAYILITLFIILIITISLKLSIRFYYKRDL
jgi:ABC-type transport system involved in multi-copper enzyme maturation permease subunit